MSESQQVNDGFIMPTVAQQLKKICVDAHFTDPNLVLDVYLVVANQGKTTLLPDEELMQDIERTDPKYWDVKMDVSKRKAYLEQLAKSNYMQALIKLQDPMKAVLTFIDHMKKALAARQRVKQGNYPIDSTSGSFSGEYADDDMLDAVDQKNQSFDAGLDFDRLMSLSSTEVQVCQDDGASAFFAGASGGDACGGRAAWTSFSTSPGVLLANAVVQHGLKLPSMYPALFENYTQILDDLNVGKLKEKDVDRDAPHKHRDQMEDLDKLSTVDPSEVGQETFDKKVVDKSLEVTYDRDVEQGMSHIFILLDVSGSMTTTDLGGRVCRAFAANVITLALLNFAFKERYKVWVLPFEGTVSNVLSATDKTEALNVMKWLGTLNYDGGGTDIEGAVMKAYQLTQSDPTYNKADIVLITDGCSPLSNRLKSAKPERTKLRAIVLNDGSEFHGRHAAVLKDACDVWHRVTWDNNTNMFSVGNTLKGISSTQSKVD